MCSPASLDLLWQGGKPPGIGRDVGLARDTDGTVTLKGNVVQDEAGQEKTSTEPNKRPVGLEIEKLERRCKSGVWQGSWVKRANRAGVIDSAWGGGMLA